MARVAARLTQRLSTRQGLWLFAWQRQEAFVPRSNGPSCLHSSQYNTLQTGLSLSQVPCANADHRIQAASMGIRIM